jgi:hypothetical protein
MKKLIVGAVGALAIMFIFLGCAEISSTYYIHPITDSNLSTSMELREQLIKHNIIAPNCNDSNITYKDNNETCKNQRNAALVTLMGTSNNPIGS